MRQWLVSLPARLDTFLAEHAKISRTKAQEAIEDGSVEVNDSTAGKPSMRLQEGDAVRYEASPPSGVAHDQGIEPVDLQLPILYEDHACMVIDKPAGVAVHPGAGMAPGERTILSGIAFLFQREHLPFSSQAVLVHRLDKDTTGCLLIAKSPEAHGLLQEQFESRKVRKIYLALVAGVPSHKSAVIDAPIGRSTASRTTMAVLGTSAPRDAQTTYRTLATSVAGDVALLSCELHTGRTHQIRVHLSTIGHPVLGDGTYTSEQSERIAQRYDIRGLCLHAWKLTFASPIDQKEKEITAPLPQVLVETLKRVEIEWRGMEKMDEG